MDKKVRNRLEELQSSQNTTHDTLTHLLRVLLRDDIVSAKDISLIVARSEAENGGDFEASRAWNSLKREMGRRQELKKAS